jgi:hypothetical protein
LHPVHDASARARRFPSTPNRDARIASTAAADLIALPLRSITGYKLIGGKITTRLQFIG